jgi:ribosome-binding protein aMBF1 (putative translation factor)
MIMNVKSIADHREKRGMSQMQLAAKAGIAQAQLSRYETRTITPGLKCASRIARALGVGIDDIAFLSEQTQP